MLPAGLTPRFFADDARAAQWRAYLDRNMIGLVGAQELEEICMNVM